MTLPPLPEFATLSLLAMVGGYLLGSIPFGLVLTRMAGLGDIRDIGSGNIGATNVLRTGNKALALLTLILDSGKGAIAALIALHFAGADAAMLAGLGGVLGHNFPIWLKFKGGKGVATTIGVHLAVQPAIGALVCATWLLVAGVSRYSSLAALVTLAAAPFFVIWFGGGAYFWVAATLGILAIVRHQENIQRLLQGTESKIGQKKPEPSDPV